MLSLTSFVSQSYWGTPTRQFSFSRSCRWSRFGSYEGLWRLRRQTKKNHRGQSFYFRIKRAAQSLMWRICRLHPAGWQDTGIHKAVMFTSPRSSDQPEALKLDGYSIKQQPLTLFMWLIGDIWFWLQLTDQDKVTGFSIIHIRFRSLESHRV